MKPAVIKATMERLPFVSVVRKKEVWIDGVKTPRIAVDTFEGGAISVSISSNGRRLQIEASDTNGTTVSVLCEYPEQTS